jgi:CHAT domain-containing protein
MPWATEEDERIRRYLLGVAEETERRHLEEQVLCGATDDLGQEYADHALLVEEELIDDYARGALSSQERELFEQNFMISPKRQQKLLLAQSLADYAGADVTTTAQSRSEAGRQEPEVQAPRPAEQSHAREWWRGMFEPWWKVAAITVALLAVGPGVWQLLKDREPAVSRGLAALQQSFPQYRPLKARVAGNFPYLKYKPERGSDDSVPIDQNQLLLAKAELARAVTTNPTARARQALGRLLLLEADFGKAEEQFAAALQAAPQEASLHVDLAALYYERGVRRQSVSFLAQAAEHCQTALKLAPANVEARFNLALCHEQMALPAEAIADWEEYLKLDATSPWAEEARSHLQKLRPRSEKRPPATQELRAELAAAVNDESRLRAILTEHFGEVYSAVSEKLIDEWLQADLAENLPVAEQHHRLLRHIAHFAKETKEDAYLTDLLDHLQRLDAGKRKQVQTLRALLRQADEQILRGEYEPAQAHCQTALRLARESGDVCHQEAARLGLARIYSPLFESAERLRLRETLVAETARRRHCLLQSKALLALANAYYWAQKPSQLLSASLAAYESARRVADAATQANATRFVGAAYAVLGERDTALNYNFAAVHAMRAQGDTPLRMCQGYYQLAETFAQFGHYAAALTYQLAALPECQRVSRDDLIALLQGRVALHYSLLGRRQDSLRFLQAALQSADKQQDRASRNAMRADLFTLLGRLRLQENAAEEALAAYQEALQATNDNSYLSLVHEGRAAALLRLGRAAEAEAGLRTSIQLYDQARSSINELPARNLWLNQKQDVYRTMVAFQWEQRQAPDVAFAYAEKSRNRELLDALSGTKEFHWQPNRQTLEYKGSATPLTLAQVRLKLPPSAQLIEYAVTEQKLLIWLISADKVVQAQTLIRPAELQRQVTDYLQALHSLADPVLLKTRAAALYRLLIAPVATELDPHRTLVVVPDEPLDLLPFSALVEPESQHYLIEDFTLLSSPSASVLIRMLAVGRVKKKTPAPALLALSNPVIDEQQFPGLPALPGTLQEIESLQAYYPRKLRLSGAQARKRVLLRQFGNYEVVHLATHSLLNKHNPLLSGIVLSHNQEAATANSEDASLRAYEIFGLKAARTRLVILSSCRSGAEVNSQRGSFGSFTHVFFSAGVPAVLASLWKVDDESAAELMKDFHYGYRMEHLPPGAALRQAQLKQLHSSHQQWRHPYYWATFTLAGDGITA